MTLYGSKRKFKLIKFIYNIGFVNNKVISLYVLFLTEFDIKRFYNSTNNSCYNISFIIIILEQTIIQIAVHPDNFGSKIDIYNTYKKQVN